MFDAVGNPQSILLLGGTSEIGLAVVSEYLRRQPLRVVLACMPGDPGIEASVDSLKAQGATAVDVVDFDALKAAGLVETRAERAKIVKKGELKRAVKLKGVAVTAGVTGSRPGVA